MKASNNKISLLSQRSIRQPKRRHEMNPQIMKDGKRIVKNHIRERWLAGNLPLSRGH